MKHLKKGIFALVLMLAMGVLAGCGGMDEEEAKEYVQATLDANYKGEFDALSIQIPQKKRWKKCISRISKVSF